MELTYRNEFTNGFTENIYLILTLMNIAKVITRS